MPSFDIARALGFDPQYLLLGLGPVFLLVMLMEYRHLKTRSDLPDSARYSGVDTLSNITLAAAYQVSDAISAVVILMIYHAFFAWRLFDIPFAWWSVLLLFLVQDFCYYFFHVASHRIRWCWASHVVHHSSERLNFSTAFRQSITYPVSGMWLFWIPVVLVGFPPEAVIFSVGISLAYQFFVHSQAVPKLGWLEWIFNTPSHHRAHHARNPKYIDRNYGGILIIWDRLFGTFVEEDPEDPPEYGIVNQIHTHNPLTLNLHEWGDLFRDAMRPGLTWRQRLGQMFGPPERALAALASYDDYRQREALEGGAQTPPG